MTWRDGMGLVIRDCYEQGLIGILRVVDRLQGGLKASSRLVSSKQGIEGTWCT